MKKFILGSALLVLVASCSNSKDEAMRSKQFTIDSLNTVAAQKETERKNLEYHQSLNTRTVNQSSATTTTTAVTPTKKKGMSNVAKGAIIGGVVGAGTGVAVSKNKVKGGIIGGVVGAAAGAGVGAIVKKKSN